MSGRRTRGRQRIPIRLIENQDDLYATFSKRRLGVYKKASELSTLCGADVGVIIFSPSNNIFSFFSPSMESVVDRHMNPNQQPSYYGRIIEHHTRHRIRDVNRRLDEVLAKKEELKQRERHLDEIDRTRQKGWWEQVPVESLNEEQLREWRAWFENLRSQVTNRIEELKNGGSSSSAFQQQNAPNFPYEPAAETLAGGGIFSQDYAPHGAAYAPTSETIMAGQFPSQYYVPTTVRYPSISAGTSETMIAGQFSSQYYVPTTVQYPSTGGGTSDTMPAGQFPSQYYAPTTVQYPSTGGGTSDTMLPGQFSSQYYVPAAVQYPSIGSGTSETMLGGQFPSQYYVPTTVQYPSIGGGTSDTMPAGQFPSQYYVPITTEDPIIGGGTSHDPLEYHVPPQGYNPFVVGSSRDPFSAQWDYFPPQAQDPPSGGGTTGAGPSNINP